MDRVETRPGERWLRGQIKIAPQLVPGSMIRAVLSGLGEGKAIAHFDGVASPLGRIKVNLRDASLKKGRLLVQVVRNDRVIAEDEVILRSPPTPVPKRGLLIPVSVDIDRDRTASKTGITFGVPFPAGTLWDVSRLGVIDEKGKPLPAQITPAASWYQDGSVKWARVDTLYHPNREKIFVSLDGSALAAPPDPVVVEEKVGGRVEVQIGKTRYVVGMEGSPVQALYENGKLMMSALEGGGLYVVDQNGRVGTASAKDATLTVESRGPVEACIKVAGPYRAQDGQEMARYEMRLQFFAGESQVRIGHTFIVSQPTDRLWFREIGWELKAPPALSGLEAIFGIDADNWKKSITVPWKKGATASLAQTDHYRFFQGDNQFSLTQSVDGVDRILEKGKEMGDWVAMLGNEGGFLTGVRDAAKRHPKEFRVADHSIRILLFSPKGGRELNFHSRAVAEDIGLRKLAELSEPKVNVDEAIGKLAAVDVNALGWAKTHEMVLSPIRSGEKVGEFAGPAALMGYPAQALSSPEWLYETRVLGRLHPYDPERFPEIESYVERSVDALKKFGDDSGEYGFRDYQAGPHFIKSFDPPTLVLWRWGVAYSVRTDLWYLYARRGQRSVRDFAEGTARAYGDNKLIHWESPDQKHEPLGLKNRGADPKSKIRGLFSRAPGGNPMGPSTPFNVPIPWGYPVPEVSSNGDLEMFLLDYYLTGNRRAADLVRAYGEGMKKVWRPDSDSPRRLRALHGLVQAYTLDWDEELGDLARASLDKSIDSEGALGLSGEKPNSTIYKTENDFYITPFIAWVLDDPRYDEVATHLADYWRDTYFEPVLRYNNPDGFVGAYLYEKSGDKAVAESLAVKLRQINYLAKKTKEGVNQETLSLLRLHVSNMGFIMRGFAVAQDIVLRSGAWKESIASTQGFLSYGASPRWLVKKTKSEPLVFRIRFGEELLSHRLDQTAGGEISIRPVGFSAASLNQDLQRVISVPNGAIVTIPKDAPPGVYEISAVRDGRFAIVADTLVPIMVALPGPWKPLPLQSPMPAIYFEVPPEAEQPKLNLSGRAKIAQLDKVGPALGADEQWQSGTINLHKGTWKIELEDSAIIHAENFAPLFAFGRPENLFPLPKEVELNLKDEKPFASPAGGISLKSNESLVIEFPEQQMPAGTVEFYYRPSKPLAEGDPIANLVTLKNIDPAPKSRDLTLTYTGFSEKMKSEFQFNSLHYMQSKTNPDQGMFVGLRTNLSHYLLPNRWVHVAFEWGVEGISGGHPETYTRIYINGSRGNNRDESTWRYERHIKTKCIIVGPGLEGEIAGLRISNIARYPLNHFTPPAIGGENWRDSETLGAWTFSGSLEAESKQRAVLCRKVTGDRGTR